jgi:hypothetical protein
MPRNRTISTDSIAAFLLSLLIAGLAGCNPRAGNNEIMLLSGTGTGVVVPDSNWINTIDILNPISTLDMLACLKCHKGLKVNTKRRVFTGTHLDFAFNHPGFTAGTKWCYTCHDPGALDLLRLESGRLVSYQKSYEQCIQCHITNYSFWAVGLHGRRTGMWNGEKQYLSCIYCHNAHTPKFKPLVPKKPPLRPA